MTDMTNTSRTLEQAESQLRELCERRDQLATPIDTGSLGRMLVHIQNIRRSISESTRDHVNAAKRLTDFAVTLGRMATRFAPGSEDLAARIQSLADLLRTAGAELASVAPEEQQHAAAS
jgi:methyl-accepting chemotaxis protein